MKFNIDIIRLVVSFIKWRHFSWEEYAVSYG